MAGASAKLLACAGLVAVSTLVGVLYKLSQAAAGGFRYSTTSAITISETVKLCMSCTFHALERRPEGGSLASAWASARDQLSAAAVVQIWFLSALYTFNNQLSFFVYTLADPGTIFLFKSASTIIVAVIQCLFAGKEFNGDQWRAMGLQACGMIIVQYDPCKSRPMYAPLAYLCMVASAAVTAVCAARNEFIVKRYPISLNVQNAVLYAGGAWMNLAAFHLLPNPNSSQAALGFFEGYDNPLAIGVVFANSMIGLAITAVYKYADAVIKCIASDITAVLLCIISTFFFGLKATVTLWCGVAIVCFAVHLYSHASASRQPAAEPTCAQAREGHASPPGDPLKGHNQHADALARLAATGKRTVGSQALLAAGGLALLCGGVAMYSFAQPLDLTSAVPQQNAAAAVLEPDPAPAQAARVSALGAQQAPAEALECIRTLLRAVHAARGEDAVLVASAVRQCLGEGAPAASSARHG